MARKQNQGRAAANAGADDMDGNVDKIRDILFGGQMRDYEQRFVDLEKRLTQRIDRLGKDVDKRVERLNAFAKREVDKLTEQLKTERKDRIAVDKSGARDLKDFGQQVEAWFGEVEEQLDAESRELRSALHEQNEELSALIGETRDQLNAALASEAQELTDSKVAREDLAGLLTEVALRLKKDFRLPKA